MNLLKRRPQATPGNDRVIMINGEKIETLPIIEINDTEIATESYILPKADAKIKFDPFGGVVYLYNCDLQYLQEAEHLKQVEENIVIKNLFDFGAGEKKSDIKFYIMAVVLLITIFLLRG